MKLFRVNEKETSLVPGIRRIIIFSFVIVLVMFRNAIVPKVIWIEIPCIIAGLACIYGIFVASVEISFVHDTREKEQKKKTGRNAKTKPMNIGEVMDLLKSNDIIEISLLVDKKVMFIGTSSDYDRWTEKFFDKEYYIDDAVYTSAEELQNALYPYTTAGLLNVISIE